MLAGSVAARVVAFASVPVLARIYSPSDHGTLSVLVALAGILAPLLSLRYSLAVPLFRRDGMAANVMVLCIALMVLLSAILCAALWIWGAHLFHLASMDGFAPWWPLLVGSAFAISLYELLSLWATRKRDYGVVARTKLSQAISGEVVKIILGLLALKPFGLLIGYAVSQGAGVGTMWRKFGRSLWSFRSEVSVKLMMLVARRYAGFPIYRLPSQLLLAFSMQAPLLFMSALFGVSETGQLGMAMMALMLPVSLIGQAVGQAFYGEIARLPPRSGERIKQLTGSVQVRLLAAGIPLTLVLFFAGEPLFASLLGEQWRVAGRFSEWLSPFILTQLLSAPLMQVMNIIGSQFAFLMINLVRSAGLLVIYAACAHLGLASEEFVRLISCFLFVFYSATCIWILVSVRRVAEKDRVFSRLAGSEGH